LNVQSVRQPLTRMLAVAYESKRAPKAWLGSGGARVDKIRLESLR